LRSPWPSFWPTGWQTPRCCQPSSLRSSIRCACAPQ
jgi:hypothetical protein